MRMVRETPEKVCGREDEISSEIPEEVAREIFDLETRMATLIMVKSYLEWLLRVLENK